MQTLHVRPRRIVLQSHATDLGGHSMRRAALASYIGSAIEFYDFFIYGTAAALVFPTVFFPHLGTTTATVASLGSFASAFLSRPVGAVFFGHLGDRVGRKRTLIVTLLIMGTSTFAVGLIPSTAAIGIAAPLLLITMRLLQGFAVGGEWAGAALMCAESAPREKRSYACMFTQLGLGTALVLTNLVFLLSHTLLGTSSAAFLQWGWRVPFLLSAVLVAVAFYIRMHVEETPTFTHADPTARTGVPIVALFRRQPRELALAAGAVSGMFVLSYQAATYFTTLAETKSGIEKTTIFVVGIMGGLVTVACVVLSARLSDTYGARPVMAAGFVAAVPWSFAVVPLIETGKPVLFGVAIVFTYAIIGIVSGPLAAFVPGIFAFKYRYTGAALTNNFAGIIGGAIPPVLSPALMATFGGSAIALMMAGFSVLSLSCVLLLRRHR